MVDLTPEQLAQEEEVTRGLLPFTIDGETRLVPELKWRVNREWHAEVEATFTRLLSVEADSPEGLRAMDDAERSLVLAYDRTGALGDLEDATEREIGAIYSRLIEVAYPKLESQTALVMAIIRRAAESVRANSTNSPSPTGTSTTSKARSRTARSSSSTARRKRA